MTRARAGTVATRGCALALALLLASGCGSAESDTEPRTPAPDFALPTLTGETIELSSLRGRPVLVDFWATWCAPCVFQIPVLNEVYERHRDDGVVVLGVSVDAGGADVVGPFVVEQEIRYPVLLGDEALAQRYGAPGYPTLFVIRPDGSIHSSHVGPVSPEELDTALAAVRIP